MYKSYDQIIVDWDQIVHWKTVIGYLDLYDFAIWMIIFKYNRPNKMYNIFQNNTFLQARIHAHCNVLCNSVFSSIQNSITMLHVSYLIRLDVP